MRDKSHIACPDHGCDRCAICRSGRCCLRDCPTPSRSDIGGTAAVIYSAMRGTAAQQRINVTAPPVPPESLPPSRPPVADRPVHASADEGPRQGKKAKGKKVKGNGKKSPKQQIWILPGKGSGDASSRPTAEEAIRERQRQTRERWAEEARQRQTEVHHHHHHHLDEDLSPKPDAADTRVDRKRMRDGDEIVDAEIIEDDGAQGAEPGRALPPGSPSDLGFRVRPNQEERRNDR